MAEVLYARPVRRRWPTEIAFALGIAWLAPDVAEARKPGESEGPIVGRWKPVPRISGTYFGMTVWPGLSWAYSPNLEIDQRHVIPGGGGALRVGQAVFPWMTLGIDASGGFYFNRDTFFTNGGLLVELGFYPNPSLPFSFRTGFGFGVGLILDDRVANKGGVGGPQFMGGVRYEFFPNVARYRARRPGGWAVGPELAWRGFTPAAKNTPMSNTILLGLWFGFYWGE
jgi:hypothetical protein